MDWASEDVLLGKKALKMIWRFICTVRVKGVQTQSGLRGLNMCLLLEPHHKFYNCVKHKHNSFARNTPLFRMPLGLGTWI